MTIEVLYEEFVRLGKADRRLFIDKAVSSLQDKDEAIELIHFLLDSIRGGDAAVDYGVSQEDAAELEQRFAELENGSAVLLEGEQVEKKLASDYGIAL